MTKMVQALPEVTAAEREAIIASPRTISAHQALMTQLPAMQALEVGGSTSVERLPTRFNVAAWNVERCLYPEESADLLAQHSPSIVLLSEMDSGMARTGQRNTTAEIAAKLGMRYAFGVEFYEMDLGGPIERALCVDDHNQLGWHGNAILSSVPFTDLALIHLDNQGRWFATDGGRTSDPNQPRVGGRMAIAAMVETESGQVCVASTHLESNADAAYRHEQYDHLLARGEDFAAGAPILIGGDLNTGNHLPPDYAWQSETLFQLAEDRGYSWELTPPGITTRASSLSPAPSKEMKLDWFCARDIEGDTGSVVPALGRDGRALSDHECIVCNVGLPS